jgi:hypothetical protein
MQVLSSISIPMSIAIDGLRHLKPTWKIKVVQQLGNSTYKVL